MKIAFISSGRSIHVLKIANGLVKNGHEVHLFTMPNHTALLQQFDKRVVINIMRFSGKLGYYLNVFELRKKIKSGRYDLVNAHYASGYGTLLRLTGAHPALLSVFGSDVYLYPFKSRFNMHTIIKNLDYADVISSTSLVMEKQIRTFYKKNCRIYITKFGVDVEKFKKTNIQKSNKQFVIGIIKKIEDIYGHKYLIRAFKMFIDSINDEQQKAKIRLKIFGRGSKREEYESFCKKLGVSDYVEFGGFIQNTQVPDVLNTMDVVCLPSISESYGVAAIEAMACEVPVITSDAAGFTEIIEDGVSGFIVPRKGVKALFEKMSFIYNMDQEQRNKIGFEGRKRVLQLYNFEENLCEYINVLDITANHRVNKYRGKI